ncbi:glycosyltransferase [Chryseobacterium culicis]|uniref:glycosyltransferase n=1 Tax=Chryseobacterium culicis TaxID=680127 RepID=UPI0028964C7F|nr:glycosyltransferase [Chryseobacterium culicis]
MNRKKILFIYYQNTKPGGIARVLSQLTAELAELNYDIEILFLLEAHQDFYPIHSKVKKHYINAFGDKYSRFGTSIYKKYNKIPKIYTVYSYLYDFGTYRVLNQWINENHQNYDIIVSCWYKISSMLAVNSKVSKKTIAWEHTNYQIGGFLYYNILRKYYKKLHAIVALTQASLDHYKKINPNAVIISNIIGDNYENVDLDIEKKENIICTVGRLHPEKNIAEFIDIIKECNIGQDWKIIIAGNGSQMALLKEQTQKLGLDNIEFLGDIPQEEILELYKKSKIFCMTSLNEGLPTVLIEAMFCGNALIAYDCPTGPSEIINAFNGYLIKMRDKENYIIKLKHLINNSHELTELMISSKTESEKWSKEKIIPQWEKIL